MAYTNSPLVTYKRLSPNHSGLRNHKIDTITIHCMAAPWTAKRCCDYFANSYVQASSNYTVGEDGIGLSVEEKNRSWATSNSANDNRAVTIEVACNTTHPYVVTDKVLNTLIKLVADICKRNNIKKLLWKGDKSLIGQISKQNMTVHRWFAAKACPGDYLYNKHSYIAAEVNKLLGAKTSPTTSETTSSKSEVVKVKVTMQKIYKGNSSNSKGQVRTLQRILNGANGSKGYRGKDGKKLTVDGNFGANTDYAVRSYQKAHKLTVDGIVGQKTWDALLCAVD